MCFSRDGKQLAMFDKKVVLVRDVATGTEINRKPLPASFVEAQWKTLFYRADGTLLGLIGHKKNGKRALNFWDLANDRIAHSEIPLEASATNLDDVILSPDGKWCLQPTIPIYDNPFVIDNGVRRPSKLYSLPDGKLKSEYTTEQNNIGDMVGTYRLNNDARFTLSWGIQLDKETLEVGLKSISWIVHEIPSGKVILKIPNTASQPAICDFSRDGRFIAVAASKGHVEIWDIASKERVLNWQPHGGKPIRQIIYSPEGDLAITDDSRLSVTKVKALRAGLAKMGLDW